MLSVLVQFGFDFFFVVLLVHRLKILFSDRCFHVFKRVAGVQFENIILVVKIFINLLAEAFLDRVLATFRALLGSEFGVFVRPSSPLAVIKSEWESSHSHTP